MIKFPLSAKSAKAMRCINPLHYLKSTQSPINNTERGDIILWTSTQPSSSLFQSTTQRGGDCEHTNLSSFSLQEPALLVSSKSSFIIYIWYQSAVQRSTEEQKRVCERASEQTFMNLETLANLETFMNLETLEKNSQLLISSLSNYRTIEKKNK